MKIEGVHEIEGVHICPCRKEFGHGNPVRVGFPSHCEA